jgi:hypothetical protein
MNHTATVSLITQPAPIYQFLAWLHSVLGDLGYELVLLAVLLVVVVLVVALWIANLVY